MIIYVCMYIFPSKIPSGFLELPIVKFPRAQLGKVETVELRVKIDSWETGSGMKHDEFWRKHD